MNFQIVRTICLLLFSINTLFSQTLIISSSGEIGSSGVNWSISGTNPIYINVIGDAQIHPSVIEECLNANKDVTISSIGNILVKNDITNNCSTRTNTIQFICTEKKKIQLAEDVKISSKNEKLNVILQTAGEISIPFNSQIYSSGGTIRLKAIEYSHRLKKNPTTQIDISGSLNASSSFKGGKITIEADAINITTSAKIKAQGNLGGGVILIGGDWQGGKEKSKKDAEDIYEAISVNMEEGALIDASALRNGNGGKVVLWSSLLHPRSNTMAKGQILAMAKGRGKGGIIETSGGAIDFEKIKISTIAKDGSAGEWLIDPWNFRFNASELTTLAGNLASTNITISTASSSASGGSSFYGTGHIIFESAFSYTSSNARTLTLTSNEDIWIENNISSSSGALSLIFNVPSNKKVLFNGDITTNGGSLTINNGATTIFQKTSGVQTINSGGGLISFGNSNIQLLRHNGSLVLNSGSGNLSLGSGSISQTNTFSDITTSRLLTWGGEHGSGGKTYGINTVVGREYSARLWYWDSWDGEYGELFVNDNGVARYYFVASRNHGGGITVSQSNFGTQYAISSNSTNLGQDGYIDQSVDITFNAQHSGVLTTWSDLNQGLADESLELSEVWETSFSTTAYTTGSRALELISTTGQIDGSTKNYNSLASVTFNTNNDFGYADGVISGTTNIVKTGTGKVRFSGLNTYTGTTTISQGTLRLVPVSTNTMTLTGNFINNGAVTFETGNVNNLGPVYLDGTISGGGTWSITSDVVPSTIWTNRISFRGSAITSGQITITNQGNLWMEGSNINSTSPINLNGTNTRLRLYGPLNAILKTGAITGTGTVDFPDGGGGKDLTLEINTGSNNAQFDGFISNTGVSNGPTVLRLAKIGTGTFTMTQNNTYTGTTSVNAGTLQIGNGAATGRLGSGAVTVATNSILNFNLNTATSFSNGFTFTAAGATIANMSATSGAMITLSGGINAGTFGSSILDGGTAGITVSGAATPPAPGAGVWIKGDVTFTGNDLNSLVILSVGTGSTMRFKTNATLWFLGSTSAANAPNVVVDSGITVSQNVGQAAGNLFYNSLSGAGTISLAGTAATHYILGQSSVANLNATSNIALVIGQGSASGSITFGNITANNGITLNSTSSYIFSGVLAGTTLTKQNTNTVTLTGANTYTGTTTISGGTLQIGNNGTTGNIGSGSIVNNGTLSINRSDSMTLGNTISGTGVVNKLNNNTATFTANNTYTGATNITGTLVLQNNAPTSSSTSYQGSGQLRIEPFGSSFTSAFSSTGWTFGSSLTSLIIGKELNTANVTIGSNTSISGPISVYGGNITINENLNTSSGNANGDILLKASADISIGASKSITTNGGDVTFWADNDATSGGTISLLSAASIQTSGGRIVLAGGLDNGSNSGISNDGIPDGYARGVGVSGISTTGSYTISSGSGSIYMKGSSNNRDGISLSANSSLTGNIISTSGNIDLLGFVENGTILNGQSGGFIQAGIRTSGGGNVNVESNTGILKIEGNGPRYGLAFGVFIQSGSVYFGSDDATQTLVKTANTSNNAISIKGNGQHGISFRGLGTKIHATAALGGITVDAVSSSWTTTIYNPVEILSVSGPINWQNSTSTDGVGIFSLGSIVFGSKSGVTGLTSSSSNININIQRLTSGASTFAIGTSGQVNILGVNGTSSFGQAFSTSSFGLNANSQTMTGFTFGAAANTQNLTFGQDLTVAGPITAYGGTIAVNGNITSSNGSTISLFGNGLSIATGKTVTSNGGQLILAPQTASNTIGLGGAAGSLALSASYFSSNFSDGFSNIQIGSNSQTGNIAANEFTLRDNMSFLTSGSLTLGAKPILGSNNVTLGSAISSISGMPTHYFQTNGTGSVIRSIANNTNFLFPIGNASYNPVSISNKTGVLDTFSIGVLDSTYLNGTSSGIISKSHVKRTWNISKNTASANAGSGVDLTFSWNANEVVGTLTSPTLNHHNGSGWEIPTMGTSSVSGNSLTYTGYKGTFSPFAIGGSNTFALPVELKTFNSDCKDDFVQIKWTTASEKDNELFELYKSLDANTWAKIYTVKGQGTKATETNYLFNDYQRETGYYRLKDIDYNGVENWSQIIYADCKANTSKTEIYPNPAKDFITVSTPWEENTTLRIITLQGVILKEERLISGKSYLSLKDLNSGIYIIELHKKGTTEQLKLIKQ